MKNFTLIEILKKYNNKYLILQNSNDLKNTRILQYDKPRPDGIIAYNISTVLDESDNEDDLIYSLQISTKDKVCFIVEPIGSELHSLDINKLKSIWYNGLSDFNEQQKRYDIYQLTKLQSKESNISWNNILDKCNIDYIDNKNDNLFDCLFPKSAILFLKKSSIKKILTLSI